MDWSSVGSDADAELICCGEKRESTYISMNLKQLFTYIVFWNYKSNINSGIWRNPQVIYN